jgi:LPXTG-motif cell wall-anchored protein
MKNKIIRRTSLIWALSLLLTVFSAWPVYGAGSIDVNMPVSCSGVGCRVSLTDDATDTLLDTLDLVPGTAQSFTRTFTAEGVYDFTIKVENADTATVAYDRMIYTARVYIYKDVMGKLAFNLGYYKPGDLTKYDDIDFSNVFTPAPDPDPETVKVYVSKVWSGVSPEDTLPPSITVNLFKNGSLIDSAVLTAAGGWRHTFSGLDAGYTYNVSEEPVEGYTASVSSTGLRYTVTNTKIENPKPAPKAELDPPIRKKIIDKSGKPYSGSDVFVFTMKPLQADAPMPNGTRGSTMEASITGEGEVEFGWMQFGLEDVDKDYSYIISENVGTNPKFEYETKTYTMNVAVRAKDGEIVLSVSYIRSDNVRASIMEFVNVLDGGETPTTPESITTDPGIGGGEDPGSEDSDDSEHGGPDPGSSTPGDDGEEVDEDEDLDENGNPLAHLPQTGQLWWPVPVLAGSGTVLSIFGLLLRRKKKENE